MPNCDGIDLDRCRKARISDCDIICADDAISIKGCREFEDLGNCEDIGQSFPPRARLPRRALHGRVLAF